LFDIANIHCISVPNTNGKNSASASASDLNVSSYKKLLTDFNISKPIWVTEAENIQGVNISANVARLDASVASAIKNGAEKIFFTGSSLTGDPMKYTTEILIKEKQFYKSIIEKYYEKNN
jgi:hypothetical protein